MKFASPTFQAFAKNEIGYTPTSPKCGHCLHYKDTEGQIDGDWVSTCDVLGAFGLIVVDPGGCCKLFEVIRAHCVPKGAAE